MSASPRGLSERVGQLPRVRLGHLPTPIEPLRNADEAIPGRRAEVLVKRDDLTGFSTAGNKLRLLEFLLGDAVARGTRTMVGCGPATSNFIAALAQASAVCGLDCEIYVPEPMPPHPGIDLARAAGATVEAVPVTRHQIDGFVADRARRLSEQGVAAYPVPRGGSTAVGSIGYAIAAEEAILQLGGRRDVVFVVPAGSCASAAGILAGLCVLGSPHRLIAVSTNRRVDEAREVLLRLSHDVVAALGGARTAPEDRLTLVDRAAGQSRADLDAVQATLRRSGIIAADHYGPATVSEVLRAAREPAARTVVWWHTGGMLGLPRILGDLVQL